MKWHSSTITPPPMDGSRVLVSMLPIGEGFGGADPQPDGAALRYEDGAWHSGAVRIGEETTDPLYWDVWLPLPDEKHPEWIDCAVTPAPKDGSSLLLLHKYEGEFYVGPWVWASDWASHDLGKEAMWSDGFLGHTDVEPTHWMPTPKEIHDE